MSLLSLSLSGPAKGHAARLEQRAGSSEHSVLAVTAAWGHGACPLGRRTGCWRRTALWGVRGLRAPCRLPVAPCPIPSGLSLPPPPEPPPPWAGHFSDLLRTVGSWSWLEGLIPWGFHPGRHGVLWSLELSHPHVSLVVGGRTWSLGGKRGSDRLGFTGHMTPEGRGSTVDSGLQALGHCVSVCQGRFYYPSPNSSHSVRTSPVLWGPISTISPLSFGLIVAVTPVCATPRLALSVCERLHPGWDAALWDLGTMGCAVLVRPAVL